MVCSYGFFWVVFCLELVVPLFHEFASVIRISFYIRWPVNWREMFPLMLIWDGDRPIFYYCWSTEYLFPMNFFCWVGSTFWFRIGYVGLLGYRLWFGCGWRRLIWLREDLLVIDGLGGLTLDLERGAPFTSRSFCLDFGLRARLPLDSSYGNCTWSSCNYDLTPVFNTMLPVTWSFSDLIFFYAVSCPFSFLFWFTLFSSYANPDLWMLAVDLIPGDAAIIESYYVSDSFSLMIS